MNNTLAFALVFLLGAAVGGLLVAIGRHSAIERIREEFRLELEALLKQEIAMLASTQNSPSDIARGEPAPPGAPPTSVPGESAPGRTDRVAS